MIEWLTVASVTVVVAAGLISVVSGIRGNPPRDLTVLGTLSVAGVLVVLLGVAIVQPLVGNPPGGNALEFWLYLVTAIAMTIAVTVWALVDRTRFGTIAMGVVSLAIAVMIVRMSIIWNGA
ncbi:unannotated protein [freshwater metagenome]|uniref:Unannotated protein n=1 Tax=freshwater metagenome TaxID=449393 RepID=A0A6J6EPW0_9ZZZZ|nr:hypothetical protein [Actinomycetota bacterium]